MGRVMHSVQLELWKVLQLWPAISWSTSVSRILLTAQVLPATSCCKLCMDNVCVCMCNISIRVFHTLCSHTHVAEFDMHSMCISYSVCCVPTWIQVHLGTRGAKEVTLSVRSST